MGRVLMIGLALAALCVAGCSDDEDKGTGIDPNKAFPYAMPVVQSMQMEASDLEQPGLLLDDPGLCHAVTALVVAWVNVNVQVRLLVPEAALVACLQQPSVYIGDSTWRWTASGGQGTNAWTAELSAKAVASTPVEWAMRVSGTALALDRFMWFYGECDAAANSGYWIYYDPESPDLSKETIECTWSFPAGSDEDRLLEFENVDAEADEYGDILHYELADSIAAISFLDASAQGTTEARWDLRDGAGRIVSAAGDTCCWGVRPLFPDVDCP